MKTDCGGKKDGNQQNNLVEICKPLKQGGRQKNKVTREK